MSDEFNNENEEVTSEVTPDNDSPIVMNDIDVGIEDIMHTAYLQYSLSVNVGRAIPDVRDGLKPVNRRILYAMRQLGLTKSHSYVKSAKVVGEVIAKYHPHGDSSVYDAMVRLAQDFSMRVPLVDGQGNFGTVDGDSAAAYRYTECRMERLAEEMLADIDKDTVNMLPTFDESSYEPEVLPARYPQLLVNGTTGIGVGMATSIPPHNLGEVINATIALLDNPQATVDDLMQYLPGPDFPTGSIIMGRAGIRRFYATGRGSVKARAKAEIIEKDGKEQIIITEIPYMVNKEQTVKRIADLVNEKRITGISDIRDETSDQVGIRIVIEIKRGAMGSVVLNQLYAHTPLESGYGAIMLVVDHNRPRVMNLVQVLEAYLEHRMEVLIRKSKFELKKAEARAHILAGLLKALENIDEVVRIIRESRDKATAGETLIERFGFSKVQANAILEMRLHQLTGLSREEIQAEYDELMKQIAYLNELLASREMRLGVIRADLLEVRDKYADPRRSEITLSETDLDYADLIPRHSCVITVSNTGYIKRVPADTYKTQHRGGKGIISMETKDDDYVEHLFNADSHDLIFFFTDRGFMYWLNVYEIPEGARTGKGRAIVNMIKVQPGEKICAMLTVKKEEFEDENKFIVMASRAGYIKKTALSQFKNLRKAGLRALVIEENDDLIGAAISSNGDEIILSTKLGMACRFDQIDDQIRPMGRTARGVTGMRFKLSGDEVVAMEVIHEHVEELADDVNDDENAEIAETEADEAIVADVKGPEVLVVTDGGMGKRSLVATYRKTNRGAKGVVSIRLKEGETVVTLLQIAQDDEVLLTTEKGQLVRIRAAEIRSVGRASKGVKIMNLNKGDRITGVAKFKEVESDENENTENAAPQEIVIANIENPAAKENVEAQEVSEDTAADNQE